MSKKNLKNKTAFSLIELSIVILIVGIVVAGVTQASRLVSAFKLSSARNITQSSPVNSIKDLAVWYETSMEASFNSSEADDITKISYWYDINPQSSTKNNAVQLTSGNQPSYIRNGINSLPVIRFTSANSTFMTYDGTILAGTNYTFFVVEQRTSGSPAYNHIIGGTGSSNNANFQMGYYSANPTYNFTFAHWGISSTYTDVSYAIGAYSTTTPRMHTGRLESGVSSSYWLNGGTSADATGAAYVQLTSNAGSAIGRNAGAGGYYFQGDIAELIIFTRALKTEERQAIETYLSKKYNITIS